MGTAAAMISAARADLGMGPDPNAITRWYAGLHGNGYLQAPWCDMAISHWAHESHNERAVLPAGDRAYTVWHADDFQAIGRAKAGTMANLVAAIPGSILFFDWGGSDTVGKIDHVGLLERNLGDGRVVTIEGNTADACQRRVRSYQHVAIIGKPAYDPPRASDRLVLHVPSGTPNLRKGDQGRPVRMLQQCLNHAGLSPNPGLTVDGDFGPKTHSALKHLQQAGGVEVDGIYGPASARVLRARVNR